MFVMANDPSDMVWNLHQLWIYGINRHGAWRMITLMLVTLAVTN
jgi:hypothetical protein